MVTGVVNAALEGVIPLPIEDRQGIWHDVEAVVDSGFTRWLTLPRGVIRAIGLLWVDRIVLALADGTISSFEVYEATVMWDGNLRTIEVEECDSNPLVGMGMMLGYQLRIEVKVGGKVEIEQLP